MDTQLQMRSLLERLQNGRNERILVFAAHPGDETLAADALICCAVAAEAKLRVVVVTDGIDCGAEWRARLGGRTPGAVRTERQRRRSRTVDALSDVGVAEECITFHGMAGGGLTQDLSSEHSQLLEFVEQDLNHFHATVVVAPSRLDLHPDHNAIGLAVEVACARKEEAMPTCLGYLLHGDDPFTLLEDLLLVPVDRQSWGRKQRAIQRPECRACIGRRRGQALCEGPERFYVDSGVTLDALTSEFTQGGLCVRSASRRLRAAQEVQIFPTDRYLRPARVQMKGRRVHAVLGSRSSDDLNIERTAFGLEFRFSAAHGPVWIKATSRRRSLDTHGWFPVKTLPRPGATCSAVCCVIDCRNFQDSHLPLIESVARMVDTVIALDDGSSNGRLDALTRLSSSSKTLRVMIQPPNRSEGAALLAVFRYVLSAPDFDVLMTLDADSVQGVDDISRLLNAVHAVRVELAVGAHANPSTAPWRDRLVNEVARKFLQLMYGRAPRDVLSNFRAYRRTLVKRAVESIDEGGGETQFKILALALSRGRVAEIPMVRCHPTRPRRTVLRALWRLLRAIIDCARIPTAIPTKTKPAQQDLSGRGWL